MKAKREFRDALVTAIEGSSRIEVVEHSYFLDFIDPNGSGEGRAYSSDEFPVIEHARIPLDGKQRADLLRTVRAMDLSEPLSISFCSFSPHHTIEFHSECGLSSSLAICFSCDGLQWSERDLVGDPGSWVEGLESFIGRLGLQSAAEWRGKLRDSGKSGLPRDSLTSDGE